MIEIKEIIMIILILITLCLLIYPLFKINSKNLQRKYYLTNEEEIFNDFARKHNRTYLTNKTEYVIRYNIFHKSLKSIENLNKNGSAVFGLTEFSDLTDEEFKNILLNDYLHFKIHRNLTSIKVSKNVSTKKLADKLPSTVDWREKNVISEVYNQDKCGACWAFSTVETIESQLAIETGELKKLSVQKMIDCSTNDNDGCNGGDILSLLQWLNKTKAEIPLEDSYPLTNSKNECNLDKIDNDSVILKDYVCKNYLNQEELILNILANHGPVAVAINALMWQNYVGGIIQYHCPGGDDDLNHAVQIVGYNLDHRVPYYIIRNSWGEYFGHNGYLYIAIGGNVCGVAMEVASVYV